MGMGAKKRRYTVSKPIEQTSDHPRSAGFITKQAAADLLGIKIRTLESWMARGLVPFLRIGRTVRFDAADLRQTLLANCRVGNASSHPAGKGGAA